MAIYEDWDNSCLIVHSVCVNNDSDVMRCMCASTAKVIASLVALFGGLARGLYKISASDYVLNFLNKKCVSVSYTKSLVYNFVGFL